MDGWHYQQQTNWVNGKTKQMAPLYMIWMNLISCYKGDPRIPDRRRRRGLLLRPWEVFRVSVRLLPPSPRLAERPEELVVVRGPQLLDRFSAWQVDLPPPWRRTRRFIHLSRLRRMIQCRFGQSLSGMIKSRSSHQSLFMTAHQVFFL